MHWNSCIRSKLALFQGILFCLIVASGTVFMHKHRTADGRIVIHTHPYNLKTDPDADHHESENQIHLLDVIFQGSFLQTDFIYYELPILASFSIAYLPYRNVLWESSTIFHAFLRGPPMNH